MYDVMLLHMFLYIGLIVGWISDYLVSVDLNTLNFAVCIHVFVKQVLHVIFTCYCVNVLFHSEDIFHRNLYMFLDFIQLYFMWLCSSPFYYQSKFQEFPAIFLHRLQLEC